MQKKRKLNTYFTKYTIDNSLTFKSRNNKILLKKRFFVKLAIIIIYSILNFLILNNSKDNTNISIKIKNKGFLNIKTIHKSNFTYYNYTNNILVYKDLYSNISYIPINKNNSIKESFQISEKNYFKLCESQTLLDKTLYKRNNKPKISVIIPYYNKDKFSLFIPLRSIQNQSFKDLEIIFVDDGSSEVKINQLIEEMKKDNRIILLKHKKRKGTLISRADGVRYASGEYIIQLDQDDLYINNLLFEKLYKKAKELNIDILHFSTLVYENEKRYHIMRILIQKNILITQPNLRTTFLLQLNEKRFGRTCTMIWDKFVRRETYLEAIKDIGDEYLNHIFFAYEDTLMAFELSQIAFSYYYYDIKGYRYNKYLAGKSRTFLPERREILAMNQLYFIKLLLYKADPLYDRYFIYKEFGFKSCGSDVRSLNRKEIDLLYEVLEAIFELERLFKNTIKELLVCANNIKRYFEIKGKNI
jgi:glycosyltransferase involved in cell wall biosynthesis